MEGMIDFRLRTRIGDDELADKVGKIVGPADYNLVVTGPAVLRKPSGQLLAVHLPGVLAAEMDAQWPILSSIRVMTDNRGKASGTPRVQRGDQKRTRTRRIMSATVGAVDPGPAIGRTTGRLPICRLTAWTGTHLPEWRQLHPLLRQVADHFATYAPDRYQVQLAAAKATHPDWLVPDTPFTTVTVNNTYSTGVHTDAGDLETGLSTLAVGRRGDWTGGLLVLARYRVAVELGHGGLLLMDAHEHHGNTPMRCPHQPDPLARPCPQGCERVSLVSYFRTKVQACDSYEAEQAKAP